MQEGRRKSMFSTLHLAQMGMMGAVSIVLVYLVHFPIFQAVPFLEYDPADVPLILSGFLFGPLAGFLLTVITAVVQGLTVSAQSGPVGIIMHIFATGSYVLVAANIYKRNKTRKTAIIAMAAGIVTMVVSMAAWNMLISPLYMGIPAEEFLKILFPFIIPFNLIKAGANSIIAFIVYKYVSKVLAH